MGENIERVAVVTGGSKGIGRAIIMELAKPGLQIVFNHFDPPEDGSADETVAMVEAEGCMAEYRRIDVSDHEAVKEFMAGVVERHGRIDVLVNNAGITRDTFLMRMKESDWDAVLAVNLKSAFNCMQAVTRTMMKQHYGRIVSIASVVGVQGNAGQANYAASKAGLIGLTRSVAKELASRNITANVVAPGYIETEMTAVLPEEVKEAYMAGIPLARPGTPEDVAGAVKFLISDEASYITGQVIHVNGGMLMA
ncbi:3-oxoacyl-[acyl-carrier-protein] reductase [Gemmatimonadota bacterium]